MSLICIGNWKHSPFSCTLYLYFFSFSLSLFLSLFLSPSPTTYEPNEFSIFFFWGSKAIRILFHSSPLFLIVLNSQPPAPRLDVGVFSQFFFVVAVVVGIFLVFISFSYNLAIENISFSDSHPYKMLQIVPTMRSCCCYFSRFFFSSILLWFFGVCHTHTRRKRETAAPRI